jgi:hypothetical protein
LMASFSLRMIFLQTTLSLYRICEQQASVINPSLTDLALSFIAMRMATASVGIQSLSSLGLATPDLALPILGTLANPFDPA